MRLAVTAMPQRWWREVLPRLRAAAANGQPWFRRAVKQRRQAQHLITIPVGSGDGSPCQAICCVSGNSFVMWDVQWANVWASQYFRSPQLGLGGQACAVLLWRHICPQPALALAPLVLVRTTMH